MSTTDPPSTDPDFNGPEFEVPSEAASEFPPGVNPTPARPGLSERKQARKETWRLIRRRPAFIVGMLIVFIWTACAVLGNRITPHHPLDYRAGIHISPRLSYPFGTDKTGRDVLSRVMAGRARCSRSPRWRPCSASCSVSSSAC